MLIGLSKLAEDCASKYLASMIKKTVADVFQHIGHGSVIFWPLRLSAPSVQYNFVFSSLTFLLFFFGPFASYSQIMSIKACCSVARYALARMSDLRLLE